MLAADAQHLAVHQHHFEAEHVVGGHAVFQAVHAARVFGDVAADGAGDLRGRVGRVVEAFMRHRVGDGEIGDAGLDHRHPIGEVDLAHLVELGHAEQHAVGERQRPAGERRAGPARHHLDALLVAIVQHLGDLFGGLRQHHHHGKLAVGGEPVALVRLHLALVRDHALARHELAQGGHDPGAPRQHGGIGFRHFHRHGGSRFVRAPTIQRIDVRYIGLADRFPVPGRGWCDAPRNGDKLQRERQQ